jgi:hypothetical protein
MTGVQVQVPIRVRLVGTPTDADLARLEAVVARLVARRLAQAGRRAPAGPREPGGAPGGEAGGVLRGARPAALAVQQPAERYEPAREQGAAGYRVPSYQRAGAPTAVPLRGPAGTLRRIELYLAERVLVAIVDDGPVLTFVLTEPPKVAPGRGFRWSYQRGVHRLSVGNERDVLVQFRGKLADLEAFAKLAAGPEPVPAVVYGGAGQPPGGEDASDRGERAEPLVGDEGVLAKDAGLAVLYLDFLGRYTTVRVDRARALHGLSAADVRAIVGEDPRARTVTRYFTQAWIEFVAAGGGHDLDEFAVLAEALLSQWDRGNYTALHNLLEIGKNPDGLGLYRRGTPLRYYDEYGQPVMAVSGAFRDSGYRAVAAPAAALRLQVGSPGLLKIFESIRHVTLDEQILIFQAAKGYADNRDLLWPEVRNGWDAWQDVGEELRRQLPVLVGFLAGHLVAALLERAGDPRAKAVGATLEQILKISGRIFQFVFVGELSVLAYRCGLELSLIRREAGKPLDTLSQRHLQNAAVHMRQLLTLVVAAGLTVATMKAAESAAVRLVPPGGGGPTLATAGGPGGGRAGAGTATAPRPSFPAPVLPAEMHKGDDQPGSAGRNEPGKAETGEEKERRELRSDPNRPARGARYFDYEGDQRGSFYQLVARLRAHIAGLVRAGGRDPVPRLDEAARVLDQDTEGFIRSRPILRRIWEGWDARLARQLLDVDAQLRAAGGERGRVDELNARRTRLQAQKAELEEFGRGTVGAKRPDLVELFLEALRAEVTDVTQLPLDDPMHNFKTLVYVELIKVLTGWTNVVGREYSSPTNQRMITGEEP